MREEVGYGDAPATNKIDHVQANAPKGCTGALQSCLKDTGRLINLQFQSLEFINERFLKEKRTRFRFRKKEDNKKHFFGQEKKVRFREKKIRR